MAIPRTLRAFNDRNFRLLWPANFIASTSRGLLLTLLAWYVLEETGSPWYVALVGFSWIFPMFALGLVGGILADSSVRKSVLVGTQAAGLAVAAVMTAMLTTGEVAPEI